MGLGSIKRKQQRGTWRGGTLSYEEGVVIKMCGRLERGLQKTQLGTLPHNTSYLNARKRGHFKLILMLIRNSKSGSNGNIVKLYENSMCV